MYDALPVLLSIAHAFKQLLAMQITSDAMEPLVRDDFANSALSLAHVSSGHVSPRGRDNAEVAKEAPQGMTSEPENPVYGKCT